MIPKKYRATELVGRKCRPTHNISNGNGNAITPATVCTIVSAHYGVGIKTDPCPCCGQYCYIYKISREELELVEEE